jgi:outer membrane protein
MEGKFMTGAIRICAAAFIAAFAVARADAAELAPTPPAPLPPPAPLFYVHAGALGIWFVPNFQSTGGGFFNNVAPGGTFVADITNGAIRPNYTLALEAGYYITPNISLVLAAGIPPIAHVKVTGFTAAGPLGTNLLGSVRYGPAALLLRYQFTQFGAIQPYFGAGAVYLLNLGNINDGILTNFSVDQNFGFVVQAGFDWMLTPNWGVFLDGKKVFLSTDASGQLLETTIPIRTHIQIDPWVADVGITFKY